MGRDIGVADEAVGAAGVEVAEDRTGNFNLQDFFRETINISF